VPTRAKQPPLINNPPINWWAEYSF
jgi:hypothetical protein